MRELLTQLSIDELVSVLYAIAVRLALRGLLTLVDVVIIRSVTDDPPGAIDRAA